MKQCLEKLIGLSRGECECTTVDSELKESKSGLYLDEQEGIDLELIKNSLGCGEELEKKFNIIYENASNFFQTDLQVELGNHYKQNHNPYIGRIGEQKYSGPLTKVTESFLGLKLNTKKIAGASAVINSILLYFNGAGTIHLKVYKGTESLLKEYTINVQNGSTTFTPPEPLVLPLTDYGYSEDYYFVYELPEGIKPMNNDVKCGCHGIESLRGIFLTPSGIKGSSLMNYSTDSHSMGISLNASIGCSIDNILCDLIDQETIKRKVAIALWYKMSVLTLEAVFSSREINFDTMSNNEYLYTRKKKFEGLYKSIIEWLGENIEMKNSDCFICNTSKTMNVGKILI